MQVVLTTVEQITSRYLCFMFLSTTILITRSLNAYIDDCKDCSALSAQASGSTWVN